MCKGTALLLWRLIKVIKALREHSSMPWLSDQSFCHCCTILLFASHLTKFHLSERCEESRLFSSICFGIICLGAMFAHETLDPDISVVLHVVHHQEALYWKHVSVHQIFSHLLPSHTLSPKYLHFCFPRSTNQVNIIFSRRSPSELSYCNAFHYTGCISCPQITDQPKWEA